MTASPGAAQSAADKTVYVPDKFERAGDRPQGWSYALTLAANLNVASNRDVVGQIEGNSFLFGASALAGATYERNRHELINTLSINEAWSRTPTIDRIVKSNDLLDFQILYNFFVNEYTGPFMRFALQTPLFKTNRYTAGAETYVRDGVPTETSTTSSFALSDAFQPLTLNESLGWFVQPLRSEPLNVALRAGFGGRHTFADGVRAVTDDESAMGVVYSVLQDVHQAGAELFAGLDGKSVDGRLLYSLGLGVLFPLLNNDDTDRSILELSKVTLAGSVGMGVFSWLSINYQMKVIRDFQLVDAVQVQNALLFSLQYTRSTFDAAAQKKADDAAKAEAQAARIAELEAQLAAAEQRANVPGAPAAPTGGDTVPTEPPAQPEPPPSGPVEGDQPARLPAPGP
jgi:hypothetical protein